PTNYSTDPQAPAAARVVYNYYGGKKKFPRISDEMMAAVDKGDSAQYSQDDILNPKGWSLLNFLMDSRTGLGRFKDFTVSNYQLMMQLIDYCRDHPIDMILSLPDVKERVDLYRSHQDKFKDQIRRCSVVHKNLVIIDLRKEETVYAGNRFMIYALHPGCNISIHALWGLNQLNTVFAVGKSIVNRSSKTNIGELMLKYGGGGHANAGTCQIDNDAAEDVLKELIAKITADG
ncbi:MAG: exopolyphosphatase, partial [Pseudomonadota bacterium]